MIDRLRRQLGYSMPRLGTVAFRTFFRLAPAAFETELFPGIRVKMNFKDDIFRSTWWQGYRYEHPLPALLLRFCSQGIDTFLDIGANYGFFSYLIAAHCPHVKIYSFEPNPHNYAILIDTKTRNRLSALFPQNLGLSDSTGQMTLTVEVVSSGHSTFGPNPHFDFTKGEYIMQDVPVITLDDWVTGQGQTFTFLPQRTVVKMDIEGFELRALKGMTRALNMKAFVAIVVEVSEHTLRFCSTSPLELNAFLESYGYYAHDLSLQPTQVMDSDFRNLVFMPR